MEWYSNSIGGAMSERVLGTDTSHWTGSINFETMYQAGARFWYTKATDAYWNSPVQWEDSKFNIFSEQALEHGKLLTGCYHWLQASIDPKVAADFYLERYKRFPFHFPPVLDFEERSVITTGKFSDYAWRAQEWLHRAEDKTGRRPFIYTAKWFTNYFKKEYISWMDEYPLIVADYSWISKLRNWPYYMPYPWIKHMMWQFSADGNKRGKEFGTGAVDIDLNWYEGSYQQLLYTLGLDNPPQPEPEPPVDPTQPPEEVSMSQSSFYVIGPEQNVRSAPVINPANILKVVKQNHEVTPIIDMKVYDKDNMWVRFPEGWIALLYRGDLYLKQNL